MVQRERTVQRKNETETKRYRKDRENRTERMAQRVAKRRFTKRRFAKRKSGIDVASWSVTEECVGRV